MPGRDVEEWFWHLGAELQRLNDELSVGRPKVAPGRAWEPRIDLVEEDHRFLLKAEIAGVRGEDIHLLYVPDRHSLLLRGARIEDDYSSGERVGIHQLEIMYGEFQREVRLPDVPVDARGMRAQYRNGFLLVLIPKMERVKTSRRYSVRSG